MMGIKGYLFATEELDTQFYHAQTGDLIQLPERKPPWIVVDHEIHTVILSQWPGRLLIVEVIDPVDNSKLPPEQKIRDDAHYTRAYGVKIIGEEPLWKLFGVDGAAVCKLLDRVKTLTKDEILALGSATAMGAKDLYNSGWNRWLRKYDPESIHIGYPHSGTLAINVNGYDGPINSGFLLLNKLLDQRINQVGGAEAYITKIIDDEEELFRAPEWRDGYDAILYAAMGYGGGELFTEGERWELTLAWERVINGVIEY